MNLGIFLSPGDSFKMMSKSGQSTRFIDLYIKKYAQEFKNVYIFSYLDEKVELPSNVNLVANKTKLHRLIYALLLPIIHYSAINKCDVVRGFGLASSISSILLWKKFVFNWAYDYIEFVKGDKKYIYIPFYYLLEKVAFIRANAILVATKSKIKALENKNKFSYLPNGVDLNVFRNLHNKKSGLIFVGRLEKQKNLFFLLDAISLLSSEKRKITFVGTGSLKKLLVSYASKKGIDLSIISPVENNQLPNLLNKFGIFVLTSFYEGSPKVLIEAMSCGLVPVATNFKTAKEVIKSDKNGIICNYNIKELSASIEKVLKDKKMAKELSDQAVKTVEDNFDIGTLIKKEIRIIKNI